MLASSAIAEEKRPAQKKTWEPKLYGFCMGMPGPKRRTIAEQSHMLRDLGFDGAGYELWFNGTLEKNLKTIDDAGPEIYLLHTGINLKADGLPYDARLPDAIRKLKGRPCTLCVLLRGYPPGDPRGQQRAVEILRELGDLSAASGIRLSIYHHKSDWTESLLFALEIVKKVNHKNVGVNFNLCHWLMVDGDKDYKPVLRDNSDKIFAVTINGAKVGSKTWTNGLIQPLDKGDFDNRELLATLREIGYGGPIGLMCYGIPGDAKDCLQRSMLVWKTWKADWLNDN
ncbi:MAG: sugar phosphate isomerase/epimerase [Pirellulales bacterium]|nr:sugar phosphate isomerase/epimerase [Pirellulales bacterium]